MTQSNLRTSLIASRVDIWLPAALGILGLITLLFLAANNANPSGFQLRIYLTLLALSSAAFAALIPGLLNVKLEAPGVAIRAAGALAVFVLVFFYEPASDGIANSIGVPLPAPPPIVGLLKDEKHARWEELRKMAADSDANIKDVVQDLRFSMNASAACFSNRQKIDSYASPTNSLDKNAARPGLGLDEVQYVQTRQRVLEAVASRQRVVNALVEEGIQGGCIGR